MCENYITACVLYSRTAVILVLEYPRVILNVVLGYCKATTTHSPYAHTLKTFTKEKRIKIAKEI